MGQHWHDWPLDLCAGRRRRPHSRLLERRLPGPRKRALAERRPDGRDRFADRRRRHGEHPSGDQRRVGDAAATQWLPGRRVAFRRPLRHRYATKHQCQRRRAPRGRSRVEWHRATCPRHDAAVAGSDHRLRLTIHDRLSLLDGRQGRAGGCHQFSPQLDGRPRRRADGPRRAPRNAKLDRRRGHGRSARHRSGVAA